MQIPPRADRPANFGDRGALSCSSAAAREDCWKKKQKTTARVSRVTQGGFVLSRAASEELVAMVLALFYRGCGTTVTPRVLDRINSEQVSTCILHPSQVCPFQEPDCINIKEKEKNFSCFTSCPLLLLLVVQKYFVCDFVQWVFFSYVFR